MALKYRSILLGALASISFPGGHGWSRALRLLNYLVEVFINGFGITRPSEEKRRQVAVILGGFLLLILLAAFTVTGVMLYTIHNGR